MGEQEDFRYKPIGHVKSVFQGKSGTPRQSGLSKHARASLTVNRAHFNNPDHSLLGLEGFSHVWLLWVFHADSGVAIKAKVAPPRLGGVRVGVFSTRSPHRPANIGLTLAKVEHVKGDTITMSGIDLIDGTPVLDIKPYIPAYDAVDRSIEDLAEEGEIDVEEAEEEKTSDKISENDQRADELLQRLQAGEEGIKVRPVGEVEHRENLLDFVNWATGGSTAQTTRGSTAERAMKSTSSCESPSSSKSGQAKDTSSMESNQTILGGELGSSGETESQEKTQVYVPEWIANPDADLMVVFSSRAEQDLDNIDLSPCNWLRSAQELRGLVTDMMRADPRSVYRKNRGSDRLYFTSVDTVHVTAWYDDSLGGMEVLRLRNQAPPPPQRVDDKTGLPVNS